MNLKFIIILFSVFLHFSCTVKHYQEAFNMRKDSFMGEQVATMVREYPTVENIRSPMNTRPYRINIHWS